MEPAEIARALAELPDIRVTTLEDRFCVHVPAIDDSVHLLASKVKRFTRIFAPNGDPAIEFSIGDEHDEWPLIIVANDVVYSPASSDSLLDSSLSFRVGNAPHLISYSEMEREAEGVALACERSGRINLDSMAGSYLLLRCFIAGAVRFGLWPVRSVAWWQRGWNAVGGDVPLPSFRPDPIWDELSRDAAQITVIPSATRDEGKEVAAVAALTKADFQRLEPTMTAVQLDDEFVSSWKSWIRITPARFAELLMSGVSGARADVTLYPEGGGSIDVRLQTGDVLHAMMQLRFSFRDGVLAIDEIRITDAAAGTGLFQRMIFNTERLAALLGLSKLHLLATGIGSYAFAVVGVYPRDSALYRKIHPSR